MDDIFDKGFKLAILLKLAVWAVVTLFCFLLAQLVHKKSRAADLSLTHDPYLSESDNVEDSLALRFQ